MRVLFLLLLLANLLYFAWTGWVAPPATVVRDGAPAPSATLRPIRLQQEALAAQSAAGAGQGAALPSDIAAASCVSLGPFAAEPEAYRAADALRRLGFTARLRAAQDEVRVGYWVRVPHLATPVDAGNALAVLQAAGLTDAYVLSEEAPGTVVSIGVYADPMQAAAVAETVSRAGFAPETSDRTRTLDVFWLDIDRQANGGIPALEDLGPAEPDSLPREVRACPSAPVSAADTAAQATAQG